VEPSRLPPAFSDLAHFCSKWGLATENERSAVRWSATPAEYQSFYAAVMPRLPAIMDALSVCPLNDMPDSLKALYLLACGFAEAAPHHELYKDSADVPHSFDARRFHAMHGNEAS
jgi:hypothetical protein